MIADYGRSNFLDAFKVKHEVVCDQCEQISPHYSFSTNFVDDPQLDSFIEFGATFEEEVEEAKIEVYEDYFWSMGMGAIRIGEDDSDAMVFAPSEQTIVDENDQIYTIFDTSGSQIYISDLYFQPFLDNFFAFHGIVNSNCYNRTIVSECPADMTSFKSVYFLMGDYWLEVLPEHYVEVQG